MQINSYIDHTILKPTTTIQEIKQLCNEALEYEFAAVCVPPPLVKNAKKFLDGSAVKTATVIGFPFGYSNVHAKKAEVVQAIKDGGDELDMVINLVALRSGAWSYLEAEVAGILALVRADKKVLKVIIESGILTDDEIIRCCEIYGKAGIDFLKTSTGYAESGASVEAVRLIRAKLPASVKIKASGGIRNFAFAKDLIEAGADRLGCSASVAIVKGQSEQTSGY
ncbi:MAG: deoxyribose-phosphate aldolase [Chitinophagaceae bacterium]|nr:MAG: deoxyribose-phosphate aldolase [Chitinophagaceae bacterium]